MGPQRASPKRGGRGSPPSQAQSPKSIPQKRGTQQSNLPGTVPSNACHGQAALTVLAAVPDEGGQAAAVGLVALVDGAAAVVQAVVTAHLLVAPGPREASGAATGWHA